MDDIALFSHPEAVAARKGNGDVWKLIDRDGNVVDVVDGVELTRLCKADDEALQRELEA